MYEDFFQLKKRPFAPVGPVEAFVAIGPFGEALHVLQRALQQGQGIVLLIGQAGSGKSHLCKYLASTPQAGMHSVYLSTAGFHTRRALLQAVLYELGRSYVGLTEQEARLQILEAARSFQQQGKKLLLILDEAQLLSPKLCEELRTLIDHTPTGEQQIQLVLAGTLELEEHLFAPELQTFNQRIGAQVLLEPLSNQESADYILARLQWAEPEDLNQVFTDDALEMICRASDGNVRCLNYLADHALLVSFVDETRPVTAVQVRNALDDLKVLPLHFQSVGERSALQSEQEEPNTLAGLPPVDPDATDEWELEFPFGRSGSNETQQPGLESAQCHTETSSSEPLMRQPDASPPVMMTVFEVGADVPVESCAAVDPPEKADPEIVSDMHRSGSFATGSFATGHEVEVNLSQNLDTQNDMQELTIEDRYARLDEHFQRADGLISELAWTSAALGAAAPWAAAETAEFATESHHTHSESDCETQLLESLLELRQDVNKLTAHDLADPEVTELPSSVGAVDDWLEYDVVQPGPVNELPWQPTVVETANPISAAMPVLENAAVPLECTTASEPVLPSEPSHDESQGHDEAQSHNGAQGHDEARQTPTIYSLLFERLRWRRRTLNSQD